MKRIVIFGYFGYGNLGDETNLVQLVKFMQTSYVGFEISVISASPKEVSRYLKVKATGKFNLIGILTAIIRADVLIGGGGSLFQDRTSLRSLLYYAGLVFLAKLFRVKVFLYGQGIGPVRSKIGKILTRWALSMSTVITVRDRLSIIALTELDVRAPEVHITAEPLLSKSKLPVAAVKKYWEKFSTEKPFKIGLVLQHFRFLNNTRLQSVWEQFLDLISRTFKVEIFLIPVHQQDLILLEGLAADFKVRVLPTHNRWDELQAAVGGLDLLVSARLHGLVAAVVQNVPCFGLAGDPKIEGFCLQLGIPFAVLSNELEPFSLCNRILKFLEQPITEQRPWHLQLPFWRARAIENQVILNDFISKN